MNSKNYFNPSKNKEGVKVKGFADITVTRDGKVIDRFTQSNIILNQGKAEIINSLTTGTNRVLARMAIGDRGALPSDPSVPKTPEASRTGLFAEVYRQDVEVTSITTDGDTNQVLLVTTFRAVDIPVTAYSDQVNPVVNEVGLVMIDLISGKPLPRPSIATPNAPDGDEIIFALRTFKTVPFEAANETAVTVRYTIFIG